MDIFISNKQHLWKVYCIYLILRRVLQKVRLLVEGCFKRQWFRTFKNRDFNVEDKKREGATKGFENTN